MISAVVLERSRGCLNKRVIKVKSLAIEKQKGAGGSAAATPYFHSLNRVSEMKTNDNNLITILYCIAYIF